MPDSLTDLRLHYFAGDDQPLERCRRRADQLYQQDGTLSHERIARDIGVFLHARIVEEPGNNAIAVARLSVIGYEVRIATYLSCGEKAIRHALAVLLRLALAYAEHPDYRAEWQPPA